MQRLFSFLMVAILGMAVMGCGGTPEPTPPAPGTTATNPDAPPEHAQQQPAANP